jgi:hypothetical protein
VDGKLVYSKLQAGKFPDESWVLQALEGEPQKQRQEALAGGS